MLNGTPALLMPNNSGFIDVQNLPLDMWQLQAWNGLSGTRSEAIGEWLNAFSQAGFTDLACFPAEEGNGCSYTDYLFKPLPRVNLVEQHSHKYLVDVDGNSFLDLYGIMEFFLGYAKGGNTKGGRDELARRIAKEGHDWATKVLRKEDMRIYMYRLLLEYARVMDEKRELLGWVDDLRG